MDAMESKLGRRPFLGLMGGAALTLAACGNSGGNGGGKSKGELVIHGFEGTWVENARIAWYEPFEAKYGIKIVENNQAYSAAKLEAMVSSGTTAWDLHTPDDVSDAKFTASKGLLEKIDFSVVKVPDTMIDAKDVVGDEWVAFDVEGVCLTNRTDKFPDGAPASWADFWDVDQFPGPRALQNWPQTTPEKALLADGVAPEDLYPLDLDRAFKSLERIKPHIKVWWPIAEQALSQQLIVSGEVSSLDMWTGRANQVIVQDTQAEIVWNQGFFTTPPFAIPKGAKNAENANLFLNFVLEAKQQAAWSNLSYYGYVNTAAEPMVKPDVAKRLPTYGDNLSMQVQIDNDWWATHQGEVSERLATFLV